MSATGQKDGIEWRTDKRGQRAYRGVLNTAAEGKQRSEWGTFAEARAWRSKALGEVAAGTGRRRSTITLRDAAEDFISGAKAGAITNRSGHPYKPTTLRGYEHDIGKVVAEIGAHRLADIRRADVQAMVDSWAAEGWEPSSIRNALDPLRVIYRRALTRDLVALNPCMGVEVPASREEPMQIVSRHEAVALIEALPAAEQALWATALYAGLRRGELQALRWSDVNLAAGLIRVSRSWDQEEGEQTPKTKAGTRKVPIVPPLRVKLEGHRNGVADTALVFGREPDKPFVPSTVRSRSRKAWKAAKLTPMGLHQCRHNFASMMIAAGCNAKALSVVMGHASISITFDRYGKLMPGGEDEVGRLLGVWLDGA